MASACTDILLACHVFLPNERLLKQTAIYILDKLQHSKGWNSAL